MAIRIFKVSPVLNGYLVHVGCQHIVFTSKKSLLRALEEYLESPDKVEKQFLSEAINPMGPIDLGATVGGAIDRLSETLPVTNSPRPC